MHLLTAVLTLPKTYMPLYNREDWILVGGKESHAFFLHCMKHADRSTGDCS